MKKVIFVLGLLLMCGCSTLERTMSGKIGCPEDEIQILDESFGFGVVNTTWNVQCHEQRFVCSLRPGSKDVNDIDNMNCARVTYRKLRSMTSENLGDARGGQSFEKFVDDLDKNAKK